MNFEQLIRSFCRIRKAIRRFLRLPPPVGSNTSPGNNNQSGSDTLPENEALPAPTPPINKSEDAESPDGQQDISVPDALPPTAHTDSNQPEKIPQSRSGARGKIIRRKPPDRGRLLPETKPELICREVRATRQWEILLVLPPGKSVDVLQGASELASSNGNEYPLLNFSHKVTVVWAENDDDEIKLFDDASLLIFKLSRNWKGAGRLVKSVSAGYYVVFTLGTWTRKGNPPVESSRCGDPKFSAHYFFADDNSEQDGFVECDSFFLRRRFSLEGKKVADDSDKGGLFVGDVLKLNDTKDWRDISWVRVGKEGSGSWGENFKPIELVNQTLVAVLKEREGWFYVRIFDEKVQMIESFDFRRLTGLEKILIDGKSHSPENIIAPLSAGHAETTVQFVGNNISIESNKDANSGNTHTTMKDNISAIISPHPNADKTYWTVNKTTEVVIRLPRIWWRMINADNKSGEWNSTPFEMSRDQFYKNREALIVVRVPPVAREIYVGFDSFNQYDGARKYPANRSEDKKDDEKYAKFRLRDFCYHRKIAEHLPNTSALRIQCGQAEFSVVHISADTPLSNQKQEPIVSNPPRTKLFRPATKNKRFSPTEFSDAGLTLVDAKHLRIAVDRRRKTRHCANIDLLKTIQREENHAD